MKEAIFVAAFLAMLGLAGNTGHAAEKPNQDKATTEGRAGADDGSRIVDSGNARIEIFS